MKPDPESDAEAPRLVGFSPSVEAAPVGGLFLVVAWPVAKLAKIIRRPLAARSA